MLPAFRKNVLFEGSQTSPLCPSGKGNMYMKMDSKALNNTEKGKPKYSVGNLSQRHFVYHKSHMDWHLIEHGPQWWEASVKHEWAIPPALKIIIKLNCIQG
jgi:hypothetical protein